jgi:hypothetical protein
MRQDSAAEHPRGRVAGGRKLGKEPLLLVAAHGLSATGKGEFVARAD